MTDIALFIGLGLMILAIIWSSSAIMIASLLVFTIVWLVGKMGVRRHGGTR